MTKADLLHRLAQGIPSLLIGLLLVLIGSAFCTSAGDDVGAWWLKNGGFLLVALLGLNSLTLLMLLGWQEGSQPANDNAAASTTATTATTESVETAE